MTIIELRQFNILRYFFLPLMVVMLVKHLTEMNKKSQFYMG